MIESKPGDSRVRFLLDELDLKYEIDDDGDFKVRFKLDDDRTHSGYVISETNRFEKFEIREVFAVAYISESPLDADLANALLIFNSNVKFGAWPVKTDSQNRCVVAFSAQIAADTDSESLGAVLKAVVVTADTVERKLSDEDQF
jgi:hypothetical protein